MPGFLESSTLPPERQELNDALLAHKLHYGQPGVRALLEREANVTAASLVPIKKIPAVIAACKQAAIARGSARRLRKPKSFAEIEGRAFDRWNHPAPKSE
jgi:hypothetical protein